MKPRLITVTKRRNMREPVNSTRSSLDIRKSSAHSYHEAQLIHIMNVAVAIFPIREFKK